MCSKGSDKLGVHQDVVESNIERPQGTAHYQSTAELLLLDGVCCSCSLLSGIAPDCT